MTISHYRSAEPMYIVMVRHNNAEKLLRAWATSTKSRVNIEGNRMKLFEQQSLNRFYMEWCENWDLVTIWDCWNKRHIYQD